MTEKNIKIPENISGEELKKILKTLKLYKELTKKLWNRWKALFKSILTWESEYKVEYYIHASKDDSLKEAIEVYKKVFWDSVSPDDIKLVEKESLEWGIKVFKDDNLVDLSFKKASEILN